MSRRSALSAIFLQRLAGRQCTGRRKPPKWSTKRLAGRDVGGLEQPLDAVRAHGREHRDRPVMVRDLNRFALAHTADRGRQPIPKLTYADLVRHPVATCYHNIGRI